MQFVLDLHCHTVNSGHAYSTITENAAYAKKIGLTHIGIADHGPGMPGGAHLYHFTNIWILPEIIEGVRVLKGAEANIIEESGKLDLDNQWLEKLDFVIASFHRGSYPATDKQTHTKAFINAMQNPNVHILGHPADYWFEIDIEAVIREAAKTGTIIELNDKTLDPSSYRHVGEKVFEDMMLLCNELKVPVLASSDAHFATLVGDFHRAKAMLERLKIDESLILNTDYEKVLKAIANKRALMS